MEQYKQKILNPGTYVKYTDWTLLGKLTFPVS